MYAQVQAENLRACGDHIVFLRGHGDGETMQSEREAGWHTQTMSFVARCANPAGAQLRDAFCMWSKWKKSTDLQGIAGAIALPLGRTRSLLGETPRPRMSAL